MGCVSSKQRLRDAHQNIFNVINVNDNGQLISPGQLEVTEFELIFHQKGKPEPTRWPYNCLRKYGCDIGLFTFECGRKCPSGQGIYAFKCRKSEQLFNLLQRNLNVAVPNFPLPNGIHNEPAASTGPPVHRRVPSLPEVYLNPVSNPVTNRAYPTLSRPGSMNSSNGQISPSTISPPPSATEPTFEHNNNKRGSLIPEHVYTNASIIAEADNINSYINVSALTSPTLPVENYVNIPEAPPHDYMNVSACETPKIIGLMPNFDNDSLQNEPKSELYVNVGLSEPYCTNNESVPPTPTTNNPKKLIYAQLKLSESSVKKNTLPKPESPNNDRKSYTTIDFRKTNALMQSITSRTEEEDGSRKTRHNASIPETSTVKQRSSLSE